MAKTPRAKKAPALSVSAQELLQLIREATEREPGYMYASQNDVAQLVELGLVQQNFEISDEDGNFATRALAVPATAPTPESTLTETTTETTTAPTFAIEDVPLPKTTRSAGASTSPFPFDALEIGQSFFVPATEQRPDPARSLASTVTAASRRYATQTGTKAVTIKGQAKTVAVYSYSRKFGIRAVEENGVKGARIGRIAVDVA